MAAELFSHLTGSPSRRNVADRVERAAVRAFDTLLLWSARGRQRRALATLDDHLLCDIGRTRAEAAHESAKPVWRA